MLELGARTAPVGGLREMAAGSWRVVGAVYCWRDAFGRQHLRRACRSRRRRRRRCCRPTADRRRAPPPEGWAQLAVSALPCCARRRRASTCARCRRTARPRRGGSLNAAAQLMLDGGGGGSRRSAASTSSSRGTLASRSATSRRCGSSKGCSVGAVVRRHVAAAQAQLGLLPLARRGRRGGQARRRSAKRDGRRRRVDSSVARSCEQVDDSRLRVSWAQQQLAGRRPPRTAPTRQSHDPPLRARSHPPTVDVLRAARPSVIACRGAGEQRAFYRPRRAARLQAQARASDSRARRQADGLAAATRLRPRWPTERGRPSRMSDAARRSNAAALRRRARELGAGARRGGERPGAGGRRADAARRERRRRVAAVASSRSWDQPDLGLAAARGRRAGSSPDRRRAILDRVAACAPEALARRRPRRARLRKSTRGGRTWRRGRGGVQRLPPSADGGGARSRRRGGSGRGATPRRTRRRWTPPPSTRFDAPCPRRLQRRRRRRRRAQGVPPRRRRRRARRHHGRLQAAEG